MKEYKQKEIRTKNARVKIGESVMVDEQPIMLVKQGKKIDFITLDELASQLYGMRVRCEVFSSKSELIL